MKKSVLLNSELSYEIARLGHTQTLCVGDAGLPIPDGVKRIDLAVTKGLPGFLAVLDAVLSELQVEEITLACEIRERSPEMEAEILARFPDVKVNYVPHEEFKRRTCGCRAIVRTGETTSYANVLLHSGVTF